MTKAPNVLRIGIGYDSFSLEVSGIPDSYRSINQEDNIGEKLADYLRLYFNIPVLTHEEY